MKNPDEGKQKVVGIQINEPQMPSNKPVMSKLDLELEKAKKEKEDLAKELEKVENEVQAQKPEGKYTLSNPLLP